ncbi:MAG TPA: CehA/McbA family metallohydrolase [Chloroflexota bacterium]|nr:CehA/McbA family metallohydrolase [Chloroflexota bacterium]
MPTVRGRVFEREGERTLEARVQVLDSTGHLRAPDGAILKRGPGEPFFYCQGAFEVDVPRGQVDVVVERGTEYRPLRVTVDAPSSGTVDLDLGLERWVRLAEQGWHAGNTHVHYDEQETRPLERLRLDPRVEDLPVLVVSRLQRRQLPYASNAFPIGRHELSGHGHVIDVGEESRHNRVPWEIGLGHIMLINLQRVVEPVSRGVLVDDSAPDYPPLVDACEAARGQGGLVLWCHNANGMEAPVAAALGKLDGLNLFDPYWMDPEYDLWYALLNCGIRLPASTGSDWFVCSSNRVYVETPTFSYERWLDGLRAGRTFVTDGPVLRLRVEGRGPSNEVLGVGGDRTVEVAVEWESPSPLDRVEIVRDGEVVATATPGTDAEPLGQPVFAVGPSAAATAASVSARVDVDVPVFGAPVQTTQARTSGRLVTRIDPAAAGWVAARCWGRRRNSYGHALWAHTSPVYLRQRAEPGRARAAAELFVERIARAVEWIERGARFDDDRQRARMLELFREGQARYQGLAER